jgi:hypothetical protein
MPWRRTWEWRHSSTILDLRTWWRCMVSYTPRPLYTLGKIPRNPLDRRLSENQSRSGRYGVEKMFLLLPRTEPSPSSPSLYRLLYILVYILNGNRTSWNKVTLNWRRMEQEWVITVSWITLLSFTHTRMLLSWSVLLVLYDLDLSSRLKKHLTTSLSDTGHFIRGLAPCFLFPPIGNRALSSFTSNLDGRKVWRPNRSQSELHLLFKAFFCQKADLMCLQDRRLTSVFIFVDFYSRNLTRLSSELCETDTALDLGL